MHHWAYAKKRDEVCALVKQAWDKTGNQTFREPVNVWYIRRSCPYLMDWDNLAASFKLVGDSLHHLGIIEDDSPEFITSLRVGQTRVSKKASKGTVIIISSEPLLEC